MKNIKCYGLSDMHKAINSHQTYKSRLPPVLRKCYGFKQALLVPSYYLEDKETLLKIYYHDGLGVVDYQFNAK